MKSDSDHRLSQEVIGCLQAEAHSGIPGRGLVTDADGFDGNVPYLSYSVERRPNAGGMYIIKYVVTTSNAQLSINDKQ